MGLRHKPGKGRKPVFAPLSETEAESELQHFVGQNAPARGTLCNLGGLLHTIWQSALHKDRNLNEV